MARRGWCARGFAAACAVGAALLTLFASAAPSWARNTKPDGKKDQAIEQKAVLKLRDFPTGWTSERHTDSDFPDVAACSALRDVSAKMRRLATASPDFVADDVTRAFNRVAVLTSPKSAAKYVAAFKAPEASACYEQVTKKLFTGPQYASVRVYVAPVDTVPSGADDAASYEIQSTVTTTQGQTITLYIDVTIAQVGRAVTNFAFQSADQPLRGQAELVDAVISRLQGAGV